MNHLTTLVAWLFLTAGLSAASLTTGEWFIDTDPGEGQGSSIAALNSQDITIAPATIDALADGPHLLGVRFQDDTGAWGQVTWRLFLVTRSAGDLVEGEYFLDNDPGEGQGTSIAGLNSQDITIAPATMSALADGPHLLGMRFQDDTGAWGQVTWRLFLVTHPGGDLIAGEYFFNNDPGEGSALPLTGASGTAVTLTPTESLDGLSPGANLIGIRFKNSAGNWGQITHRIFLNPEPEASPLNRIEFVLLDGETELTSGALLGDGSMVIQFSQVSLAEPLTQDSTLVLQLQAVDGSDRRGHKLAREIAVQEFSENFLDLFFSLEEQGNLSISGDNADADNDGLSNLLEQATGLHPREANSPDTATVIQTQPEGTRSFRFRSAAETIFDPESSTFTLGTLTFELEISANALNWNKATSPEHFTISPESAPNEDGSYTQILELSENSGPKQFHRLKITR